MLRSQASRSARAKRFVSELAFGNIVSVEVLDI
jgi:hypothetical protein